MTSEFTEKQDFLSPLKNSLEVSNRLRKRKRGKNPKNWNLTWLGSKKLICRQVNNHNWGKVVFVNAEHELIFQKQFKHNAI